MLKILGDDDFGHRDYVETPGGGVNENEDLKEAVVREIKEETGCDATVIDEIGYVEVSTPGDGHVMTYIKQDGYYYLINSVDYVHEQRFVVLSQDATHIVDHGGLAGSTLKRTERYDFHFSPLQSYRM